MPNIVAVLEDDREREEAMHSVIRDRFADCEFVGFAEAPAMIAWLKVNLGRVRVISLDHDLEPLEGRGERGAIDPGTGREVVDFLAGVEPACPVIIHTTNYFGREGMKYALMDAGWEVRVVYPAAGVAWIRQEWAECVMALLALRDRDK